MTELPWRSRSTSKRARQSENKAAKLEGGRRVIMSGAGREKGDVKAGNWLIQDKFTDAASFRLTLEDIDKAIREAIGEHRLMQFRIVIRGRAFRLLREEDYLAMVKNDKASRTPGEGSDGS